ncbi:hypothetical protein IQ277_19000 [Nostocales cyanobacterium LEGE 12452]|nr:hypothetical protein [Nostocales cyanobacterium LEGE 12452]
MKKYFSSPRLLKKIVSLSSIFFTVTSLSFLNASVANSQSTIGFYKQQNRPEVYLIYQRGFYCRVQNEDQMNAFGGFRLVSTRNLLNFSGRFTGDCGWPNGFFKLSNRPAVYRMFGTGFNVVPTGSPFFSLNLGNSYCRVRDEAQMNAYGGFGVVNFVSPSSDLGRGRRFRGVCPNP